VSLEITNYQLIIIRLLKNYKLFKIVRDENLRIYAYLWEAYIFYRFQRVE